MSDLKAASHPGAPIKDSGPVRWMRQAPGGEGGDGAARSRPGQVAAPALELWGGVECTVNRVGDHYRDQVALSGHDRREGDLTLFAELGLCALRYPVLWERTAPDPALPPEWTWSDRRLARLRELGVRPIVGLVHHGSGPRHTDLVDPGFAAGLGRYAGLVASRYPWVEEWTPINEPLTTARFSALYGHWYPHGRDERSFWLALLNQVDATRAAMQAVRRVNPAARLIQTDDLGRTYATEPLGGQADHDNQRRWAAWDLLFGRVHGDHPLAAPLAALGFADRLGRIADDPCPPDVIGVNHYLTSDRFLDHRTDRYPAHLHGGNGQLAYADTEAVRVLDPPVGGLAVALRDAWERYATPLAITEVHNGSTRDEQMRWAAEAWDAAVAARASGIDVRAVTAWSLLGSHGWDTLLTGEGRYEPGVFDLTDGPPRPTALATLWRGLPLGLERAPVAREEGWWRRPGRLLYPTPLVKTDDPSARPPGTAVAGVWLTGDMDGPHGQALIALCRARGIGHVVGRGDEGPREPDLSAPCQPVRPWLAIEIVGLGDAAVRSAVVGYDVVIADPEGRSALGAGGNAGLMSIRPMGPHGADAGLLGRALDFAIDQRVGEWRLHGDHAPRGHSPLLTVKGGGEGRNER